MNPNLVPRENPQIIINMNYFSGSLINLQQTGGIINYVFSVREILACWERWLSRAALVEY